MPLPPCSCCLPTDFGSFLHPGKFSNLEAKVLRTLISLKPALGSWLLKYGSHTDKCTKWQLTARRRQNTYKKQTRKLLHDSGLGAWASPVIPSVHSPPRENWLARTQQLSTPFSAGLFSTQGTRVLSPFSFLCFSSWLPPLACKDAHITDHGNAQQSATLLTKFTCFPQEAS